jgi:hypothetical protein
MEFCSAPACAFSVWQAASASKVLSAANRYDFFIGGGGLGLIPMWMLNQFFLLCFGDYGHAQTVCQYVQDNSGNDNEP